MLVTVRAKPCVGGDAILVEDTERTEGLVARVTIAGGLILSLGNDTRMICVHEPGERERMEGLQPAMVCMTSLVAATRDDPNGLSLAHYRGC